MKVSRNKRRQLGAIGLAALVATAGTAYAANNTVASRNAGQGVSTVAGFTVVDIGYLPSETNPELVGVVTFTITRDLNTGVVDSTNAGASVSVDAGANYYPCTIAAGFATCPITEAMEFIEVDNLSVVAYDLQGETT
jgi:hypothetical protein